MRDLCLRAKSSDDTQGRRWQKEDRLMDLGGVGVMLGTEGQRKLIKSNPQGVRGLSYCFHPNGLRAGLDLGTR